MVKWTEKSFMCLKIRFLLAQRNVDWQKLTSLRIYALFRTRALLKLGSSRNTLYSKVKENFVKDFFF